MMIISIIMIFSSWGIFLLADQGLVRPGWGPIVFIGDRKLVSWFLTRVEPTDTILKTFHFGRINL